MRQLSLVVGKRFATALFCIFLALAAVSTAVAKDAIQASVISAPADVMVTNNGNPYSMGTYAVGTIQLWYTVTAPSFQGHSFPFTLRLQDVVMSTTQPAVYGSSTILSLHQAGGGSGDIVLTPSPASFPILSAGLVGDSTVTVAFGGNAPTTDGTELVGNLQMSVPNRSYIDTVTTVQVHARLVHPQGPCLHVFDFITGQDMLNTLSSITVNVNDQQGKVTSTTPYGQLSENILIANTCGSDKQFDLGIALDPSFETNPHDNPGQAVFTYLASTLIDSGAFQFSSFTDSVSHRQNLCLQNLTVPAGQTLLATVHTGIIKKLPVTSLTASPFTFIGSLYDSGSGCPGTLYSDAEGNPATTLLPYATQK